VLAAAEVAVHSTTRMWANAQRDGYPAKYRWRPVKRRKVWLTPTTRVPCSNAANMPNPLKLARVSQTLQQISAEVRHIVRTCGGDFFAV